MCGRYALHSHPDVVALQFGLASAPELQPRYNIAPGTPVLTVRAGERGNVAVACRWGLIPSWAKDPAIGNRLNNARAETAAEKPSFRSALRARRCLIPADGFYEWQAREGRAKQPFYIHGAERALFGFAGLYETWNGPDGPVASCAILTTSANSLMAEIHDRMPVIVAREDYRAWLDPGVRNAESIAHLLAPYAAQRMAAHPVSTRVNNARNESAALIEPVGAAD